MSRPRGHQPQEPLLDSVIESTMDAQSRLLDIARLAIEAAGGLRRTNLQVEAEKQQRMGRRAGRCA